MTTVRETADLHFAAYVVTLEHSLTGARRDGKRVIFAFEIGDPEWNELLSAWGNRTGMVVAFEYASALKALKTLVHAV